MKITVFGAGYVGLVQAAVLADVGNDIICIDIDEDKVRSLNSGSVSIFEPDLENMVRRNIQEGRLCFSSDQKRGVEHGRVIFIAVGTPPDEDGSADLKYVLGVARSIGEYLSEARIVVIKSTVPVGTADKVSEVIRQTLANTGRNGIPFNVASNPEFLKEGSAVADCQRPERIIVGTDSAEVEQHLRDIYAPFSRNRDKMIVMDVRSAELTKYAANAMLATKISFINEMSNLAERLGADIEWVRKGIGSDSRIGYDFIYPGIGYGGSCFPKDVQALIRTGQHAGLDLDLMRAVERRNINQKQVLVEKILDYFGDDIAGKTFALWGLAFKPNTDDMREAPSRVILEALWAKGAKVQAFDPQASAEANRIYGPRPDLVLAGSRDDALSEADALIIATEWRAFRSIDLEPVRAALKTPVIFDGRNLYDPPAVRAAGLDYVAIGRSSRR